MSAKHRYPAWLWLCLGCPALAVAEPATPPGWQAVAPTARDGLSQRLHVPQMSQNGRPANIAYLMVNAPLETVVPAVEAALGPLGQFTSEHWEGPQAYLREGWDTVLMSRHPALRAEYAQRFHLPGLQQLVSDGALLPHELTRAMTLAEASDASVPQNRAELPSLQRTYASWDSDYQRRYGLTRRTHSTDRVSAQQMDGLFGAPTTVVSVTREVVWPNPDGGFIDQIRNINFIGGGAPPRYLTWHLVPATTFTAVYSALNTLPGVAAPEVHPSPGAWVVPIAPPFPAQEPALHAAPDTPARTATLVLSLQDQPVSLTDMLPLPDGSLLLYEGGRQSTLWRLRPDGTLDQLWHRSEDRYNARARLLLDTPRGNAYLTLSDSILKYTLASSAISHHPLQFADDLTPPDLVYWRAGPDGLPAQFDHRYSFRETPRDALRYLRSVAVPDADGEPWHFALGFLSPRQQVAHSFRRGNTQLRPLDTLSNGGIWVEEPSGLALLRAEDGHVSRAITLPRRFGPADPADDTGMAQWVPDAFGSPRGGWIATGFVLGERQYGMHVTRIDNGHTQLSATLNNLSQLRAAAGSPDGRWLALAGTQERTTDAHIGLWDVNTGKAVLANTGARTCRDMQQLAWSVDGRRLWILCQRSLLALDTPD